MAKRKTRQEPTIESLTRAIVSVKTTQHILTFLDTHYPDRTFPDERRDIYENCADSILDNPDPDMREFYYSESYTEQARHRCLRDYSRSVIRRTQELKPIDIHTMVGEMEVIRRRLIAIEKMSEDQMQQRVIMLFKQIGHDEQGINAEVDRFFERNPRLKDIPHYKQFFIYRAKLAAGLVP